MLLSSLESGESVRAWHAAWIGLGLTDPVGSLESLIARYSEPHRADHNLRHIEECFHALIPAQHLAEHLVRRRIEILKGFLDRERIFQTECFYDHLESSARANIRSELSGYPFEPGHAGV
jgi:predicted metal-dependent HD superfamily phosphohydrolase